MVRSLKEVNFAEFCDAPAFATGRKPSRGSKGSGHRYEKLLGELLVKTFGSSAVKLGPWIKFSADGDRVSYAQPDAIVTLPSGGKAIVEAKLTQTLAGQAQLKNLYEPLVRFIYPGKKIWLVNTYKNVVMPGRWELSALTDISLYPAGDIIDHHWIPRK